MNVTISKTGSLLRAAGIDILLMAAICAIPAVSHVLASPLYKLNPMLLALVTGMALVSDRRNGYLLAVLLPLASMIVTGMPVAANAVCMIPELLTVVAVFGLVGRYAGSFVALVAAALAGKVVFYLFRALFFSPAVLLGTGILVQIAAILAAALLYVGIEKQKR